MVSQIIEFFGLVNLTATEHDQLDADTAHDFFHGLLICYLLHIIFLPPKSAYHSAMPYTICSSSNFGLVFFGLDTLRARLQHQALFLLKL